MRSDVSCEPANEINDWTAAGSEYLAPFFHGTNLFYKIIHTSICCLECPDEGKVSVNVSKHMHCNIDKYLHRVIERTVKYFLIGADIFRISSVDLPSTEDSSSLTKAREEVFVHVSCRIESQAID